MRYSLFDYYFYTKENEPLFPPGRPKYLKAKGHYRPTTYYDIRCKNLLIQKRRNKKKRNKRSYKND